MVITGLEAVLLAGFGATFTAIATAVITSRIKEKKFVTKEACLTCGTRQWVEDLRQMCKDTYYLKQVVRLLAEKAEIPQHQLVELENASQNRTL